MINLHKWALKWGVSSMAIRDLQREFGMISTYSPTQCNPGSEAMTQSKLRLAATKAGGRLWRNNVGAMYTSEGSFVRYGLCNDSKKLNDKIKSSDLIGIKPVLIQPSHVGHTIGQFVAQECKAPSWGYVGTAREAAQLAFIQLITSMGGYARFNNTGEF